VLFFEVSHEVEIKKLAGTIITQKLDRRGLCFQEAISCGNQGDLNPLLTVGRKTQVLPCGSLLRLPKCPHNKAAGFL
jgi:hypothetical protein